MLKSWLKRYWPALFLCVLLIALLDGVISSLVTCHPITNQPNASAKAQETKENCTALHGPILISIRWAAHITQKYDGVITAALTLVLAFFTGTLWWSTDKLWQVTNKTLRHAERTTQRQLRAYVWIELTMVRYPPHRPDRIGVGFKVTNSGQTWARNLVIRKAVISRDFKAKYDPWDRAKWEGDNSPMVLGPNQSMNLQLTDIWLTDIPGVLLGDKGFDFAIWATYNDTLTDPPVMRQTQLSQRFAADQHGGTSVAYLPTHNCADDDCPK